MLLVVHFLYGLVFFTAGALLGFQSRLPPTLMPQRALAFLAAFALTHGLFEWTKMLTIVPPSSIGTLAPLELLLLATSFTFLIQFAIEVLISCARLPKWTRLAGVALLALAVLVVVAFAPRSASGTLTTAAMIRYSLGLTGSLSAAAALLVIHRARKRRGAPDRGRLRPALSFTAFIFLLYGLLAGLIVPPAPFFPATWLNRDTFLAVTGLPVELLRAACGLLIAASLSETFVVESAKEHAAWERRREEFIAVVAHDLRSPINTIAIGADFLQKLLDASEPLDRARAQKLVGNVKSSATRLDRMVSDLLDTSRIDAHRLVLRPTTVELRSLLRCVIERGTAATPGHPLKLVVPEALPTVLADAERVEQVLLNLLSNAAKYSSPASEIRVEALRRDGSVEVAVTNLGTGLCPEEQRRLFTRFYRTGDRRGDGDGLGLGLYIAKGLVEAQGGRIWVDSTPGASTTFSFTLPCGNTPEARLATHSTRRAAAEIA